MFHVKQYTPTSIFTSIIVVLLVNIFFISCASSRDRILIEDYYIVPNGKEILGSKPLHVFVFENDQSIIPFQQFVTTKFGSNSYFEREFNIKIEGSNFKMIIYDKDEFNKYVNYSNFIVSKVLPQNARLGDQPDFTGISFVSENNEDCLKEGSLFEQIAIKYLKNLKDEYLKNAR